MAKSIMQDEKFCYVTGSTYNLDCHHCIHGISRKQAVKAVGLSHEAMDARYRKYRRKRVVMGNEIMELEQRVYDLLERIHRDFGEQIDCDGIRCDQCPLHQSNIILAARGFVKELIYERGTKVVE